jgi:DNA invertase Pin-like site-specific DNA recombinase
MNSPETVPSKVTTTHRAKLAYVYVRQSSLSQVMRHGESTELQYRLVERALALGWPRERVQIIDDDLGKSGTDCTQRVGFQQLIAEIGLARVGLVISLDASRLARNNSDWHRLLELCALFGALIADSEQLYDPCQYHDRLLLGLSGMMSEAELHQLKIRLHAGERQKAERGELRLPLPAGLERQRDGTVTLHPDEEVQARLRLVFEKFEALGSARAVMRYLRRQGLSLPIRALHGSAPHELIWQPPSASRVLAILHNPAYAGAYVYGQTTTDPTRREPGHSSGGLKRRPLEQWPVCRQGAYPAYISWAQYQRNRTRLRDNQNRYQDARQGVPRQGQALLQGLVVCGRCGARMRLRYSAPLGQYPVYDCSIARHEYDRPLCQAARALALDAAVERQLLAALEPDKLALALSTLEQLEQEAKALQRQRQLRLERAHYEAERARRQYHAVEPENRLVARNLERQWEEKLRAVEALERVDPIGAAQQPFTLSETDRRAILAIAEDLPQVWHAPTTTPADRKQMLRLVIDSVIVDAKRTRGRLWYQINWQTGATSAHELTRRVHRYAEHPQREALQHRVLELSAGQKMDQEIATTLNAEGFLTARGQPFSGNVIWLIRQQWQVPSIKENGNGHNPLQWRDGTYSVEGLAAVLGVTLGTVYKWLRSGLLKGCQVTKGLPWKISLSDQQLTSLREHVTRARRANRSTMEAT